MPDYNVKYAGLYDPASDVFLPLLQPLEVLVPEASWKRQAHEVPLTDGGVAYGNSQMPLKVKLSGSVHFRIDPDTGQAISFCSKQERLGAWDNFLASVIQMNECRNSEAGLHFFMDNQDGAMFGAFAYHRHYRSVLVDKVSADEASEERGEGLTWSMDLTAYDPNVYGTAPGV